MMITSGSSYFPEELGFSSYSGSKLFSTEGD